MRTTFLLLFTLLACGRSPEPPAPPAPATGAASGTPELTDSLVLTTVFGQALRPQTPNTCLRNSSKWYSTAPLDSTRFSREDWRALYPKDKTNYVVERIEEITEGGVAKQLAVLCGEGTSCHSCPGVVDCAVFSSTPTGWKLDTYQHNVAVFGVVGYPVSQVEVLNAGPDAYLLVFKNGSVWQGVEWRFFTAALYHQGRFEEVLKESVGFSSGNWSNAEGDFFTPAYAYTAHLYTQPGQGPYRDLIVHYQGTQLTPNGKGLQLLDREVRFEYRDGFYATRERLPE